MAHVAKEFLHPTQNVGDIIFGVTITTHGFVALGAPQTKMILIEQFRPNKVYFTVIPDSHGHHTHRMADIEGKRPYLNPTEIIEAARHRQRIQKQGPTKGGTRAFNGRKRFSGSPKLEMHGQASMSVKHKIFFREILLL